MRINVFFVILITLLTVSCRLFSAPILSTTPSSQPLNTATPKPVKTKIPTLDGEWTISMQHSGGIMGLMRSIEISSDGKFTVVDEGTKKTVTGKFSLDELSKLKERVSTSEYISQSKPEPICADCFVYDLEIQGNGKKFNVQLNDISLPNSGLEPLVDYLRSQIDLTLK
jgi:hypothetical protein